MNPAALVAVMSGAQASSAQMIMAAKMLRMNMDASGKVAKIIESAQQNMKSLANVANGVGQNVNIVA